MSCFLTHGVQSIYIIIIIIITNNYIFTSCYSVGSDNLHRPTSACVLITPGGAKLEAPPTFKAGVGHMKCPHLIRGSMGPLENAPQRTSLDRFSRFALLTLVSALSMHADTSWQAAEYVTMYVATARHVSMRCVQEMRAKNNVNFTFLNLPVCSILYAKHKLYFRTVG